MWLSLGYNLIKVNYIGSIGYGLQDLEKSSKVDIQNCQKLINSCLERYKEEIDLDNLWICGVSYGGYLTCCLICEDEPKYKAAYSQSPFLSFGASLISSDIPDYYFSIAFNEDLFSGFTQEQLKEIDRKSVFHRIHKIKTPLMFITGKNDKRCPSDQAKRFTDLSETIKKEVIWKCYPLDGHGLFSTKAVVNSLYSKIVWFEKYAKSS